MNFIIMGPQGSGKGTQGKLLSEKIKIPAVSVGKLLRNEIRVKSSLGKKIARQVNEGKLIPLTKVKTLLLKEFHKPKYRQGIILDGFPRNLTQNKFLHKVMTIDYMILITVPTKVTIERLGCRRVCACGELYNVCVRKPKVDMLCDVCGKKLFRREDDYPLAIRKRLNIYHTQTKPVIEFYRQAKKLITVSGNQSINGVHDSIIKALIKKGIK